MDLHGQIMNLRCVVPIDIEMASDRTHAYKLGQRDARHAAAELALKADECIEALRDALMVLRGEALPLKRNTIQRAEKALLDMDAAKEKP